MHPRVHLRCLRHVCWLPIAVVAGLTSTAHADPSATELRADGVRIFAEARELARRKDPGAQERFRKAAQLLEKANALEPSAGTKFNTAVAWDSAQELARAADAFEASLLLEGLADDYRSWANDRLKSLRLSLERVRVELPTGAAVRLPGGQRRAVPLTFHLEPGRHTLVAECPGGAQVPTELQTSAGASRSLILPCPTQQQSSPPTPTPVSTAPAPQITRDNEPVSGGWIVGWTCFGAGVLLGGTAAGIGVATLNERDQFQASGNTDAEALDRGLTLRTWTNVTAFSAAALGATGLVLVLALPSTVASEPQPQVSIRSTGLGLQAGIQY